MVRIGYRLEIYILQRFPKPHQFTMACLHSSHRNRTPTRGPAGASSLGPASFTNLVAPAGTISSCSSSPSLANRKVPSSTWMMPMPFSTTVHGGPRPRGKAKSLLVKILVEMPTNSEACILSSGGCKAGTPSSRGRELCELSSRGDMFSSTAARVGVMEPATLSKTRRSFRQLWSGGMRQRLGLLELFDSVDLFDSDLKT
mmetsp:Transcript_1158/g.1549  ORF Transcript_1158/g.1549 Transcript_1158/m.1549 type:complete len:200 (-) Transcript_1158:751-1350(-)